MTVKTIRRWIPWVALVIVVAVALALGAGRSAGSTSLEARTMHIASEVRCPVCEGQSAAQSQAPASILIRNQIRADLQAGQSENRILASLVNAYGVGILEKPEAQGVGIVVWVVPVIVVIAGIAGLGVAFARWGAARKQGPPDERDRALVERALRH